ncbi:hypothetical protein HMPREF9599_01744 [Cutibacterium acnes HL050PA2]|nr:hypothetical protein HMPREF9599_01744 [Cutibacterium acnes HL050PA2]
MHKHRKMNLWIQPGGHVEHTENPWQALAHELHEETGYSIDQLSVLQPWDRLPDGIHDLMHPTPVLLNTHSPYPGHFHSDIVMAMVAHGDPAENRARGSLKSCSGSVLTNLPRCRGPSLTQS